MPKERRGKLARTMYHAIDGFIMRLGYPGSADRSAFYHRWDRNQFNGDDVAKCDARWMHDLFDAADAQRETDREAAFQRILALAEAGSIRAMEHVGWAYAQGDGVEANPGEARVWKRRAMEAGSLWALLSLGSDYSASGDLDRCEEVYGVGAAMGWAPAMYWLARTRLRRSTSKETVRAVMPLLEAAAAKGSPAAQDMLASYLLRGPFGWLQLPKAIRMLERLASREMTDFVAHKAATSQKAGAVDVR